MLINLHKLTDASSQHTSLPLKVVSYSKLRHVLLPSVLQGSWVSLGSLQREIEWQMVRYADWLAARMPEETLACFPTRWTSSSSMGCAPFTTFTSLTSPSFSTMNWTMTRPSMPLRRAFLGTSSSTPRSWRWLGRCTFGRVQVTFSTDGHPFQAGGVRRCSRECHLPFQRLLEHRKSENPSNPNKQGEHFKRLNWHGCDRMEGHGA